MVEKMFENNPAEVAGIPETDSFLPQNSGVKVQKGAELFQRRAPLLSTCRASLGPNTDTTAVLVVVCATTGDFRRE